MPAKLISVNNFCETYGFGRTRAYEIFRSNLISTVLYGRRRLVVVESAEEFVRSHIAKF